MIATQHQWRFSLVAGFFWAAALLILWRIVGIQFDPQQLARVQEEVARKSQYQKIVVPPRGQIYDRHGDLLAGNIEVFEIGVDLGRPGEPHVKNPLLLSLILSQNVPGVTYEEVFSKVTIPPSSKAAYVKIADYVSREAVDKLNYLEQEASTPIPGESEVQKAERRQILEALSPLIIRPHLTRYYPEKALGSNILGFVSREERGYFGVEEYYNDILAGRPRAMSVPYDPRRVEGLPETAKGAHLVLTIEREVQLAMEELIDQAVAETGASSGTIVVYQPRSGEILAMATTPRMDLNEYWRYEEIFPRGNRVPFNRAISQHYETGSTFKPFTMAIALELGIVTPDTVFVDQGFIDVGGHRIVNWNGGAWGPQDMIGCLQHSLNVCLAWVATQIGQENFYRYLKAFGIGSPSGVDLAGEVSGILRTPSDENWDHSDLGTNSFGQGVSATPLQMVVGLSALANEGVIMVPHVVRSIVLDDYQYDIEPRVLSMPISAQTARTLSEMLARSLEKESSVALVEGYRVAGKTGTAEIPVGNLGYATNLTNASFVGWGPLDDPQFLVYVWLEKPLTAPWGSVVAAPVFRQAVEQLVIYLNIPPDKVRKQLAGEE